MIYWTYEDWNSEEMALAYKTRLEAVHAAEEDFEQANDDLAHGETREEVCNIVSYDLDDDGNITYLTREPYTLFAEGYHGDFAEHNTYWRKL